MPPAWILASPHRNDCRQSSLAENCKLETLRWAMPSILYGLVLYCIVL
jgi:hypothetical protein